MRAHLAKDFELHKLADQAGLEAERDTIHRHIKWRVRTMYGSHVRTRRAVMFRVAGCVALAVLGAGAVPLLMDGYPILRENYWLTTSALFAISAVAGAAVESVLAD